MFKSLSMAGTGLYVFIVITACQFFGVTIGNEQATGIVENVVQLVSFVLMVVGQARRPELLGGLVRRK